MIARGIRSAPLTFAWLLVLLVTTRVQRSAGRWGARRIQRTHSTNLRHLRTKPSRVLATSLFWLDDVKWWPLVPIFVVFVAAAERRLRWWRWLLIGSSAHVIGTYAGQEYLRLMIRMGRAPRRLIAARDVGVSYFVFGTAGALSGYIRRPWRSRCQLMTIAALIGNVAVRPTFTEVGHLTAFLVGLAAVPTAPDRDRLAYPMPEGNPFEVPQRDGRAPRLHLSCGLLALLHNNCSFAAGYGRNATRMQPSSLFLKMSYARTPSSSGRS